MPVDTRNRMLCDQELKQLRERTHVDELLTTEQLAALLVLQPQTLRRWSCEGSGPIKPLRIAGRLRWRLSDAKALLAGEPVAA